MSAFTDDAKSVTETLGGHWFGSYGAAACPVCQPERERDQNALTVSDGNGRLLLDCKKSGCTFTDIMAAAGLRTGGYRPDPAPIANNRENKKRDDARRQSDHARRLWKESHSIHGTPAEAYLRGRGITCDLPETLRFHPQCPHGPSKTHLPALVALVEGGSGFGIHRTYLKPDGSGKADVQPAKMMLGSCAGGAVRLSGGASRLVVGEGIETALSLACGLLDEPATIWAALSTSGVRGLCLPAQAGRLTVAVDGDEAGRAAGHDLSERAQASGWNVEVADPGDNLDWNDRLTVGADDEIDLVPYQPEPRYRLLSGSDMKTLPEMAWCIKGVLPAVGMAQIYGPSKSGKSFLAWDMACAVAEGRAWFGYRVRQGPVVYLVLEGEAGIRNRVEAWTRQNGRPLPADLYVVLQGFKLTDDRDIRDIAAVVPAGAVVVIDTQNRAAPAIDENSSRDMGAIIEGAKRLQELVSGMVVLVAHTGKDATKGPRGHSSQIPALDAAIEVTRNGDYREWRAEKVKDGRDGARHGFRLDVVDLGIDADDDPVTSCVVEAEERQTTRQKPLTEAQRQAVASYLEACTAGEGYLKGGTFAGLHRDIWREHYYRISTADSQDTKKKSFQRIRSDLVAAGLATALDDIYRLTDATVTIREMDFTRAAKERDTGHYRDITGTCPGQETGQTGHHPIGVSRCPGVPVVSGGDADLEDQT
jgi:hypothetical protein